MIKLKQLESVLQQVDLFDDPDIDYEQYPTQSHIASRMCFLIESRHHDFSDKTVIDLGCGTGMLSIGSVLCNASHVIGMDIDSSALQVMPNIITTLHSNHFFSLFILAHSINTRQTTVEICYLVLIYFCFLFLVSVQQIAQNNINDMSLTESIDLVQCDLLQLLPNVSKLLKNHQQSLQMEDQNKLKNKNKNKFKNSNKYSKNKNKNKNFKSNKKIGKNNRNGNDSNNNNNVKTLPKEYKCQLMEYLAIDNISSFYKSCDTVIMNPPFGTKPNTMHSDLIFLKIAIDMSRNIIYSLHKSSTRDYLLKTLKTVFNVKSVEVMAQLRYDLPKSYKFHKQTTKDINVDLLRIDVSNLAQIKQKQKQAIETNLLLSSNDKLNKSSHSQLSNNTCLQVESKVNDESLNAAWEDHLFMIVKFLNNREISKLLFINHSWHLTVSQLNHRWKRINITHDTCVPNWKSKTNFVNISSLYDYSNIFRSNFNFMTAIRNSIVVLNIDLTSFVDFQALDNYLTAKSKQKAKINTESNINSSNRTNNNNNNNNTRQSNKKNKRKQKSKHKSKSKPKHKSNRNQTQQDSRSSSKSSTKNSNTSSTTTSTNIEMKSDDIIDFDDLDHYLAFENNFHFSKIGHLPNLRSLSLFFHHWPDKSKSGAMKQRNSGSSSSGIVVCNTDELLHKNRQCSRLAMYHPFAKLRKDKILVMNSYYNMKCEILSLYGEIENEIEEFLQNNQQIVHFECIFDFIKKYENVLNKMPNLEEIIVDSTINTFNSEKLACKESLHYLSGLMNNSSFINPQWFGVKNNLKYLDIGIENQNETLNVFYQLLTQLYKHNIRLTGLSVYLIHLINLFDNKKLKKSSSSSIASKNRAKFARSGKDMKTAKYLLQLDLIVGIWRKYLEICMMKENDDLNENKSKNDNGDDDDDSDRGNSFKCCLRWFNIDVMFKNAMEFESLQKNEVISDFIFRLRDEIVQCLHKNCGISLAKAAFNDEIIKFTMNSRKMFVNQYCNYPIYHDTIELTVNKYKFDLVDQGVSSMMDLYRSFLS